MNPPIVGRKESLPGSLSYFDTRMGDYRKARSQCFRSRLRQWPGSGPTSPSVPADRQPVARRRSGRAQLAFCRPRITLQRSVSRSYALPARSPSPSRSAARPSATSAAEWSSSSCPAGRVCTRPP
ncbi:hypothetical protein Strvi_0537 [Streptomyces violaceusniger Tu 4113]|uniref:Uncharacterized protein n=1 Tax=Streptomyces violaceusniger (strain Tu 4113) TaxID=653045 RepID=G2PBB5_STRV4|nr:hypothetical protein Strvi_0537 [Streptomyces violaceusniger Tu 4113]